MNEKKGNVSFQISEPFESPPTDPNEAMTTTRTSESTEPQSSPLFNEPIIDKGSFHAHPLYDDSDLQQTHRAMYLRAPPKHSRGHRNRRKSTSSILLQYDESQPMTNRSRNDESVSLDPSERVQFILSQCEEDADMPRLLIQMDQLKKHEDDALYWEQVSRWIKFEEDVEPGSDRWCKPRVATLSLHSLLELRTCILNGLTILDMEATSIFDVIENLTRSLVNANQRLDKEFVSKFLTNFLTLPHIPQYLKSSRLRQVASNQLHHIATLSKIRSAQNFSSMEPSSHSKSGNNLAQQESEREISDLTPHTDEQNKGNVHLFKKLPPGTEAANVLVAESKELSSPIIALIRFNHPIIFPEMTEVPIPSRYFFLLFGPSGHLERYYEIGRCVGTLFSDEIFLDVANQSKSVKDILAGVDEFLDQVIVLPPGEWDPNIRIQPPQNIPEENSRKKKHNKKFEDVDNAKEDHSDAHLRSTGRFCGGIIEDIKRKLPWYFCSDFIDGLCSQSLASFFFLYFACLAPIVTFGGLLGDATNYNLATIESLVSGALCGIVFSLFSGQPLIILGSTGPILIFEKILYQFSEDHNINYLSFRCCIGLWTFFILFLLAVFDASCLVKYVTRFTEEVFASLISLIFIYQAIQKLLHVADHYPLQIKVPINSSSVDESDIHKIGRGSFPPVPDVFLFSIILFISTFTLAIFLKSLKPAPYFPSWVRQVISDFAISISIICMVLVDMSIGIQTPKLLVPSKFQPTKGDREWFISPIGSNPWWTLPMSLIPALLASILLFLDQQITAVIINRKENKLKKGCGYHLDLVIVSILIGLCSMFGIPWFIAATVLSLTHVNSLRKESTSTAPGELPKFLGIREQRLTGLLVFIFIGLSVLMTNVLTLIPMPVLYGVFLYMGVSSLHGVQFIDRIMIMLMPQKYQPDYVFLRSVKTYRVHLFTTIQIVSLSLLWFIKSNKKISITFPLMVCAVIFIRFYVLDKIFTQRELKVLDDVMPDADKKKKIKEAEEKGLILEDDALITDLETAKLNKSFDENKAPDGMNINKKSARSFTMSNISKNLENTGIWHSLTKEKFLQTSKKLRSKSLSAAIKKRQKSKSTTTPAKLSKDDPSMEEGNHDAVFNESQPVDASSSQRNPETDARNQSNNKFNRPVFLPDNEDNA